MLCACLFCIGPSISNTTYFQTNMQTFPPMLSSCQPKSLCHMRSTTCFCMLQPCVPMFSMSSTIAALCHFVHLTRLHFNHNFQFSRTRGSFLVVCSLCRYRRARCFVFVSFLCFRSASCFNALGRDLQQLLVPLSASNHIVYPNFFSGLFLFWEEHSLASPPFPFQLAC